MLKVTVETNTSSNPLTLVIRSNKKTLFNGPIDQPTKEILVDLDLFSNQRLEFYITGRNETHTLDTDCCNHGYVNIRSLHIDNISILDDHYVLAELYHNFNTFLSENDKKSKLHINNDFYFWMLDNFDYRKVN